MRKIIAYILSTFFCYFGVFMAFLLVCFVIFEPSSIRTITVWLMAVFSGLVTLAIEKGRR